MTAETTKNWLDVSGRSDTHLEERLSQAVALWESEGKMPADEQVRVHTLSMALAKGSFVASPERLELLRGLCQIYSAGIRGEKISSHRKVIGPVIVSVKKILFRIISALLGPTFSFQRDFNAGVIRLLGSLCNEAREGGGR